MSVTLTSRFPEIVAELRPKLDPPLADTAQAIADDAATRVPVRTGALRDAIHVERKGIARYEVKGGNDEAWYGGFVEFGTSHSPPHPFMIPAAEDYRDHLAIVASEALGTL